jgi:L-cysteate sulfo-lyase
MSGPVLTTEQLRQAVKRLPRVDLAHLPTPLEEIPRFSERINGPRLFIKRDDCTGLLFGGNKTRHIEFLLADALQQGADMVVWGAGIQSNNCRQTAAACAKLGLECRLYLYKGHKPPNVQGNLLLDYLVGARVELVDTKLGPELDQLLTQKAEEFRKAGRKVYAWDRKHVNPLAAISYALCVAEIVEQLRDCDLEPGAIYASSAGATGAGLVLGKALLGLTCPLRLIAPLKWPWDTRADLAATASRAAELLGLPHRLTADDVDVSEGYIGSGYSKASPGGAEALQLLATSEGILLDPVYTAKALAALIDDVRTTKLGPNTLTVFIHTGGQAAVFAYPDEVLANYVR